MSVPGSKIENPEVEKSSGPNPIRTGDSDSQPAAGDGIATSRAVKRRRELGGPDGPDPTRYGDWERKGRCIDF